ncbi:MAG: hypothetical protein K6T30_04585 [Alicyclobacillus sp.]|nr:hypothetical protein [Alicyclobacillus sp.]
MIRSDRVRIDIGTANGLVLVAFCLNTGEVVMVDAPQKNEVIEEVVETATQVGMTEPVTFNSFRRKDF